MGASCKCSPRGRECTLGGEESHFYWAEEGAVFNSLFQNETDLFLDTKTKSVTLSNNCNVFERFKHLLL